MERSDGRLATVSYLFGAPAPEEPVAPQAAPSERVPAEREPAERVPARRVPAPPAAASGWYVEPGGDDEAGDDQPGDDDEPAAGDPEPAAIAAARRFLSAVEPATGGAERAARSSSGVHFEPQPEETAPERPPVRKASINALARKGMSSAEMITLLENREIEPDEAAAEVARLEDAGLLDDHVLAENLVRTLRERKGLGKSAITAELRRRRVDQAAIDEALESVDVDDELERATEVAVKRAGQLRSYDRQTAERRLSAFLQRRGYSGTVVGAAVNAALGPAGPRFR